MPKLDNKTSLFLVHLQAKLGDDYIRIVTDIIENYRIVDYNSPIVLRRRRQSDTNFLIGVNPEGPRFFYFKAAIEAMPDSGTYSRYYTIKELAHRLMLEHYKTHYNANSNRYMSLVGYFPSQLDKIVARNRSAFRIVHGKPPNQKALTIKCLIPGWSIKALEDMQIPIKDPFELSTDKIPTLSKPIADEPPQITVLRQELLAAKEEVQHDWEKIPDDD